MNLTSAQAKALGRRAQQPTRAPGELVAVFAAGKVKNPLNGAQWGGHLKAKVRYRKEWRERVSLALLEAGWPMMLVGKNPHATTPKRITLLARTWSRMDAHDGLRAALKPVVDALVDCQVIHSDAPQSGHEFVYEQVIDRARRGVEIRVRPSAGTAVEAES